MISVGTEFKETVDGYFNSWLPAYDIVKDAIETRKENDPEGRLIMFETSGCPWKEHLFNIEEKLGIKGEILYVIYKKITSYLICFAFQNFFNIIQYQTHYAM